MGHLGAKRVRQIDLTAAGFELGPVPALDLLELSSQARAGTRGQERGAVVVSLAAADHEDVAGMLPQAGAA